MGSSNTITAAIFSAFLKCPTKARLLAIGERSRETYFSDVEAGISSMCKSRAWRMLHDRGESAEPATFGQMTDGVDFGTATRWFDCDTAVYDLALSQRGSAERSARKPASGELVVPVLFAPWEKLDLSDSLLVCFGALSLSQVTGVRAETGALVYGDNLRRRTVRISDHAARLDRTLQAIGSLLPGGQEPLLVLNAHCAVCDFRSKCRGVVR